MLLLGQLGAGSVALMKVCELLQQTVLQAGSRAHQWQQACWVLSLDCRRSCSAAPAGRLRCAAVPASRRAAPDAKLNDIKALLGKMLFSGAGMEKKVGAAGLVGLWVGSPAGGCVGWQWAQQSALGHCHSAVSHMQEKATLRRACDCPGRHLYTTSAALTSQPYPCRRRLSG